MPYSFGTMLSPTGFLSRCALVSSLALSAAACNGASAAPAEGDLAEAPPVTVAIEAAGEQLMPRSMPLTGTLVGTQETRLAANGAGRVIATEVERGDAVAKGQIIARLDTRMSSLSAREAAASVKTLLERQKLDSTECERAEALFAEGAISKAEVDRTRLRCATAPDERTAATARASMAMLNVSDGTIRSPFAGAVTSRMISVGEYVRPDTPVFTLVNLDTLRLEVAVPEIHIGGLAAQTALRFRVPAHVDRVFEGKLRATGQSVRPATRDVLVDADVPNDERLLLPGMFASVELSLPPAMSVVVAKDAVFEKDGKQRVFVLGEGHLEERVVETGSTEGDRIAVLRGVSKGDPVVKKLAPELRNGMPAKAQ